MSIRSRAPMVFVFAAGVGGAGLVGACSDEVTTFPGAASSSNGSSVSSGSSSSSGQGGAGGATATPQSQNVVAIGGCFDSGDCDVPRDDDVYAGCVSCQTRPDGPCAAEVTACDADTDCAAIRDCVVTTCGDSSCVATCEAANSAGATLYRDLLLCGYCGCNDPVQRCQSDLDALTPAGSCN